MSAPFPAQTRAGLDLLATATLLIDRDFTVQYANPAAENLFELGSKSFAGHSIAELFHDDKLNAAVQHAWTNDCGYTEHELKLGVAARIKQQLSCTVSPVELSAILPSARNRSAAPDSARWMLIEFHHAEPEIKIAREELLLDQSQANRELIRNLAHEIRNPLGGIRGAAQLLDRELDRQDLHEYTQVIIKEADRLQSLMDRMLRPHRLPKLESLNIHEVLERVRSLILAEYPQGITLRRDYDTSLPLLTGDMEQLIQVVLNVVRNAVQAMKGEGEIRLRTRIARQVTLARKRYRRALELRISDTGPGIPEEISDHIFLPLVTGREGGSGMGLTLAQTYLAQHGGTITFESHPVGTTFIIMLPIGNGESGHGEVAR